MPSLTEMELQPTVAKIKHHFEETGTVALEEKSPQPDTFTIQIGSGKSGLLREPFEEYVTVARDGAASLRVTLTRIISHPIDFSADQLQAFREATQTFFREATGREVRLEAKGSK